MFLAWLLCWGSEGCYGLQSPAQGDLHCCGCAGQPAQLSHSRCYSQPSEAYAPPTSTTPSVRRRHAQVNYNLLAVNAFMAVTGLYQLQRKIRWDMEQKEASQAAVQKEA